MHDTYDSPIPGYELFEVYDFYDFPSLFSCVDMANHMHLAICVEDLEDGGYRWLLVPVSQNRLRLIKSGKMTVRDAFLNAESGTVLELIDQEESDIVVSLKLPSSLPEEDLPGPNYILNYPDDGRLPEKVTRTDVQAVQNHCDVLDVSIAPNDTHIQEVDAEQLGKILLRIQGITYSLADGVGKKGKLPKTVLEDYKLRVVETFAASFGVRLEAAKMHPLLGESKISFALERLVRLISIGAKRNELKEMLQQLNPRAHAKYRFLLQALKEGRTNFKVEWGSPNGNYLSGNLSYRLAEEVLSILEESGENMQIDHNIEGKLSAVDTENRTFKMTAMDGEHYNGKIAENLNPEKWELPIHVSAKIRETISINQSTQEESSSYELCDFIVVHLEEKQNKPLL